MIFLPPDAPVHVIVDHIATTPGLPIWATTLISAGIGAVFGVLSGSFMEVAKPVIQRSSMKRRMRPQLLAEFRGNLYRTKVIAGDKKQPSDETVMEHAFYLTTTLDQSRFRYYLEKEPLVLYEIDASKHMQGFYDMFQSQIPELMQSVREGKGPASSVWGVILNATTFGDMFLDSQNEPREVV